MFGARFAATLLAALLGAGIPASAAAHGDEPPVPATDERELRALQTAGLRGEHARAHALARAAARARPAARERELRSPAAAAVEGHPRDEIGAWSPRYGLPDYVMNAAL